MKTTLLILLALVAVFFASCDRDSKPTSVPVVACEVSADTLDFGTSFLQEFKLKEFTITNTGTSNLDLKATTLNPPFNLVLLDTTAFVLPPGGSKTATVTFEPQSVGSHVTSLSFGNEECADLVCTGTGEERPTIFCDVEPVSLDFGEVQIGESAE